MRATFFALLFCTSALSACGHEHPTSTPAPVADAPKLEPTSTKLDVARREEVIRAIKADLRNYFMYQAQTDRALARNNVCKGAVSLHIKSVTISLVSIEQEDSTHKISAAIPLGPFDPSLSVNAGGTQKSNWKTTFTVEPIYKKPASLIVMDALPGTFDAALRADRESMIAASDDEPCFTFPKDQKNSIEAGFQVIKPVGGGIAFSFLLFAIDSSFKQTHDATNTISVQYEAVGEPIFNKKQEIIGHKRAYLMGKLPVQDSPALRRLPKKKAGEARPR